MNARELIAELKTFAKDTEVFIGEFGEIGIKYTIEDFDQNGKKIARLVIKREEDTNDRRREKDGY